MLVPVTTTKAGRQLWHLVLGANYYLTYWLTSEARDRQLPGGTLIANPLGKSSRQACRNGRSAATSGAACSSPQVREGSRRSQPVAIRF